MWPPCPAGARTHPAWSQTHSASSTSVASWKYAYTHVLKCLGYTIKYILHRLYTLHVTLIQTEHIKRTLALRVQDVPKHLSMNHFIPTNLCLGCISFRMMKCIFLQTVNYDLVPFWLLFPGHLFILRRFGRKLNVLHGQRSDKERSYLPASSVTWDDEGK